MPPTADTRPAPPPASSAEKLVARLRDFARGQPWWLVLALGVMVLFARRPDAFYNPQFWSEDGMFFQTDYLWGPKALLVAYNGYHHLIPRLVAFIAGRLDPAIIPAAFFVTAVGLTLYVMRLTLSDRFPFPRHIGYALAVVVVPDAFEVLLNIANVQWILAAGLILVLLLRDPVTSGQKIHDTTAALLIGLTGPFSIVLFPLFAVRAWRRRTTWSVALAVMVGVTAVIQGFSILHGTTPFPTDGNIHYDQGLAAIGLRTGGSLFLGRWLPVPPSLVLGWALAIATFLAGLALTLRRGDDREARIMLASAAILVLAGALYRYRGGFQNLLGTLIGARYFFGAQLVFLWLLLTTVTSEQRWLVRSGSAAIVLFLAANLTRLREPAFQDFHWQDYVDRIRAGEALLIPTNPPGATFVLPEKPRS